ncbi:hypothetical protein PVA45_07285 (plasmid) [Entomospira entomophila]|uniref:Uncharacterized protein n=1 Tax=Entomospira entomophila TaxID=2719988 RepID=A0A968KS17_9SPIO|nr:hypothetical protein [Entomospira entomophilus]NIZ41338.1 hypothetical protein [Entomospira entomophilus]WDI36251.1 hypothetical protein PVA45_07285 [Entomospira entomophilus]
MIQKRVSQSFLATLLLTLATVIFAAAPDNMDSFYIHPLTGEIVIQERGTNVNSKRLKPTDVFLNNIVPMYNLDRDEIEIRFMPGNWFSLGKSKQKSGAITYWIELYSDVGGLLIKESQEVLYEAIYGDKPYYTKLDITTTNGIISFNIDPKSHRTYIYKFKHYNVGGNRGYSHTTYDRAQRVRIPLTEAQFFSIVNHHYIGFYATAAGFSTPWIREGNTWQRAQKALKSNF